MRSVQAKPHHLQRMRQRDEQFVLRRRQHQSVGIGQALHQHIKPAIGAQPQHATNLIAEMAALGVGEVQITVVREHQVIGTREVADHGCPASGDRIERHNPVLSISNKNPTVTMDLQAVRLAVIVREQMPSAIRSNAEDAPVSQIHAVQIARTVKGRPFQEGVHRPAATCTSPRALLVADPIFVRQAREDLGLHCWRRGEHGWSS